MCELRIEMESTIAVHFLLLSKVWDKIFVKQINNFYVCGFFRNKTFV